VKSLYVRATLEKLYTDEKSTVLGEIRYRIPATTKNDSTREDYSKVTQTTGNST